MINTNVGKKMFQKALFLIAFLALCSFSHVGMAQQLECEEGELNLDLMTTTFIPQDSYKAHIYGLYQTTAPFEKYELKFAKKVLAGVMSAKMVLYMEDFGPALKNTRDPVEIKIRNSFEVSTRTKGLYIEVLKSFNSGDRYSEFFWINFDDINIETSTVAPGKVSVCLKPEDYR